MGLLNLSVNTTPGVSAFKSNSTPTVSLFLIVVITEGIKEEVIYLNKVKQICEKNRVTDFKIVILNDYYDSETKARAQSHPLKRLDALEEWRNKYKDTLSKGDEEWLICDRDNPSFKKEQYEKVLQRTSKESIHFIVSNPAFQIWLLMHFTADISSLDLDSYEKSKKRLDIVEKELKKYVAGYKHGSLSMIHFVAHIRDAINNSKNNPTASKDLEYLSGSNFGDLLESIESKSGKRIF